MNRLMEVFFSDHFQLGFLLGMAVIVLIMLASRVSYKKTLLMIAKAGSREMLVDGRFYYLVHESEHNALLVDRRRLAQAEDRLEVYEMQLFGPVSQRDYDVAGAPKLKPNLLEHEMIKVVNDIKAWADGLVPNPLSEDLQMRVDVVLGMASIRRVGVRA